MNYLGNIIFSLLGAMLAWLEPTFPYILVCTICIIVDAFSAWLCALRVKKNYTNVKVNDKFSSKKFSKIFTTMLLVYGVILCVYAIQKIIFKDCELYLPNIVSGAFCFYALSSILENISTARDAKWANVLQMFFRNKAERHFDIDLNGDGVIGDKKPRKRTKTQE